MSIVAGPAAPERVTRLAPMPAALAVAFSLGAIAVFQAGLNRRIAATWGLAPTIFLNGVMVALLAGGFFFDEFSVMPPKDLVWFSFGVAVSLAGVAMHSLHRATVG